MNATKNFSDGTMDFKVKNVKDVLAAKSLGFPLCDVNGYFFDDYVVDQDEDGVDYNREPTEEEKTNRAIEALQDGDEVFAVFETPEGYTLVEDKATTLQSDFFVGQWVYTVQFNEVVRAQVKSVQMTTLRNGCSTDIVTDRKYEIAWNNKTNHYNSVVVSEDNIFPSVEKLTEYLANNIVNK